MYGYCLQLWMIEQERQEYFLYDGMNSKNGIKRETVKKQQSPNQQHIVNVMPRWDKKKHTKKTKQQEKAMKVIDTHEGEKSKTSFKVCCSGGKMTAMEQYCCKFQLKVVMDTITNHWWLMSDSNIEHSNHPLVTKETEGIQFWHHTGTVVICHPDVPQQYWDYIILILSFATNDGVILTFLEFLIAFFIDGNQFCN